MDSELLSACKRRRLDVLNSLPPGSVLVVPGAQESRRNNDVNYNFRQDSDFLYLSGFTEPNSYLLLVKDLSSQTKFIMFVEPKDAVAEIWNGFRYGIEGVKEVFAADESYPVAKFSDKLEKILDGLQAIYYSLGTCPTTDDILTNTVKKLHKKTSRGLSPSLAFKPATPILHEMRLIKDDYEIKCLERACNISASGHKLLMQKAAAGLHEYQLAADFIHHCTYAGCNDLAYQPIVASGVNACCLHHMPSDKELNKDDLLLVDAGGEYKHYAADITRTYPVKGKFSKAQAAIYSLVLNAQTKAIAAIKPGIEFEHIQSVIVTEMVKGLVELGILKGDLVSLIQQKSYDKYYMHSSGHWLGLDVHDVGFYKVDGKSRQLVAGMCLTVEPGLYLPATDTTLDSKWRGIAVRIEDDILVTSNGYKVLSANVPKDISAIEAIMQHETL